MKTKKQILQLAEKHFNADHCRAAFYKGYKESAEYLTSMEQNLRERLIKTERLERERDVYKAALERLKGHQECDDCYYSCPLSEAGCCNPDGGTECTCNGSFVQAALAHGEKIRDGE